MPTLDALTIRPPEARDFDAIARLINHFIEHTSIHFGDRPLAPEEHQRDYEANADRFPWYVAEMHGRFAGYAKSSVWRARAAYSRSCETSVYIEAEFHRTGVARALYQRLLDDLRERGFHVAVAGTTLPNDPSVRFHEAMGFRPVGTFHEVGRKFDQWHDVGFFELKL